MDKRMNGILLVLLFFSVTCVSLSGAVIPVPLQLVSKVVMEVNGSDMNMGCAIKVGDLSGMTFCGSLGSGDGVISYLVDDETPAIDTSTSDWASQLVTVKLDGDSLIVLSFGFGIAISLTSIKLDLFLCPEWNIGAPLIAVYGDNSSNLPYTSSSDFILNYTPNKTSCDSLSTVTISVEEEMQLSYSNWHILVSTTTMLNIEWIHVGEVRFLGTDADSTPIPSSISREILTSTATAESSDSLTLSTSTMDTSTPSPPSNANTSNSTPAIAAGVVVGLIVLVVAVGLIFMFIMIKKRRHSKTELVKLQDVVREPGVELKSVEQDEEYKAENPLYVSSQADSPGNGHQQTATNSSLSANHDKVDNTTYYSVPEDPAMDDDLYTMVDEGKKAARKPAPLPDVQNVYAAVDDIKHKSLSPAPTESAPVYSSVEKNMPPASPLKSPALHADVNKDEAGDIYSDVTKPEAPVVPAKSPALEVYLATKDAVSPQPTSVNPPAKLLKVTSLPRPIPGGMKENPNYESTDAISSGSRNSRQSSEIDSNLYAQPYFHTTHHTTASVDDEGIYSEPINPSDFAHGAKFTAKDTGGEDDDPRIYSSIYTVATTTPDEVQKVLEVTGDNIVEEKDLGTGQFGKVVLAHTNGLSFKDLRLSETDDDKGKSIHVAVKKLRSNPSKPQREVFDKEIKFMSRLQHPNVVRFIGVCYYDPAFIMMEYMKEGDLSQFLQRYSEIVTTPSSDTQIATSTVIQMALQIASGMKYLASQNFIHRDLASRNCLVGENFTVKLADFGMSRNLYESHYYRIQGNAILPIRWMATECFYGKFSEKTDVWAFGITMWELFTLAKDKPYPHLNDTEMVDDAVKGVHRQLLLRPAACPESVYKVMLQSWIINPKTRATFEILHEMLQKSARDYE